MGPVLIPVIIFIIGVFAIVGLIAYLTDQSAEHHDGGNG